MKRGLIPVALVYPDREGGTHCVKDNDTHKWKYIREMGPDEYVLIKGHALCCFDGGLYPEDVLSGFDSVQDGSVAILTPHMGFPTRTLRRVLRESIEVRALACCDNKCRRWTRITWRRRAPLPSADGRISLRQKHEVSIFSIITAVMRPPGEMASRLTTNQEIAGSSPAVVKWIPYHFLFTQ